MSLLTLQFTPPATQVRRAAADIVLRSKISSTLRVDFVLARKGKDFVANLPYLSVSRALGRCSSSHHRKRYPAAPDDILTRGQDDILSDAQDDILAARGQKKPRHRIGARVFLYLLRNA
jgi:hypothetical protein